MTRVSAILASPPWCVGLAAGGFFAMRAARAPIRFADCRRRQVAGRRGDDRRAVRADRRRGRRVTDAEAITGPTLVYFGYSFCPDVCPIDLSRNALAAADAGGAAATRSGRSSSPSTRSATRPRWCATSPRAIDPGLVGLTGTPEEVAAARPRPTRSTTARPATIPSIT